LARVAAEDLTATFLKQGVPMNKMASLRNGLLASGGVLISAGMVVMALSTAGAVAGEPALAEREPFTDQACLDCHTDEDRLTELAVVEEVAHEALSSGPG
jgi:hypothetical protein